MASSADVIGEQLAGRRQTGNIILYLMAGEVVTGRGSGE